MSLKPLQATETDAEPASGPQAGRRRIGEWWRGKGRDRKHVIAVTAITAVVTTLYAIYLLIRYYNGSTGLLDLGIYDQAIRGYAHFQGPHSPVVGLADASDPGKLQLSDHFTPILMLFAPFYWLHDSPTTLLTGTAILCASAIPPIWVFTRRALGPAAAYLIVIVYAVAWENQTQLWFAFHEVAFTAPVIAWMLERAQAGKRRQAAAISLILLLVKDDMGFLVAAFGIYLLFQHGFRRPAWLRRDRLIGAGTMVVGGVLMVELVNKVLIPHFGGSPTRNWTYNQFGSGPGQVLSFMLEHPLKTLQTAFTPYDKITTLGWLLLPVLFLCVLSPITLLALPLLAERYLSDNPIYWGTAMHYNAFLTVILILGSVDGAARLARWTRRVPRFGERSGRVGIAWAALAAVLSVGVMPRWPMWEMTHSAWWHSPSSPEAVDARQAAAKVPNGALVSAVGNAGVFLLDRTKVFMWSYPGDRTSVQAPWVVAHTWFPMFPFRSVEDQRQQVANLKSQGYVTVFEQGGYIVLHRP